MCINSGENIEGCFSGQKEATCVPLTCAVLGHGCDSWNDGCGETVNCGSCSSGYTCSSGTCTLVPVLDGGGGGGGGGATLKKIAELKIIPEEFNLATNIDKITSAKIDLFNVGKIDMMVTVSMSNSLKNIISSDETSFNLNIGGTKTLAFSIRAPHEPGIYAGKIIFSSGARKFEVPFVLNVRSELSLFDISLDIPPEQRIINAGDKINGQISLVQAGLQEKVDVSMHYIVKDFENNIYLENSETIMVYQQKNYEHEFNTQNLPPGNYILGAEVVYEGGVATASYPFVVIEKKFDTLTIVYILLLFLLVMGIIVVLIIIKYYKRQNLKYNR